MADSCSESGDSYGWVSTPGTSEGFPTKDDSMKDFIDDSDAAQPRCAECGIWRGTYDDPDKCKCPVLAVTPPPDML